jgi:hypothetical protein
MTEYFYESIAPTMIPSANLVTAFACVNKGYGSCAFVLRLPFFDCTAAHFDTVYGLCIYLVLVLVTSIAQQTAETVSEQNGWRIEGSEHIGKRVRRILELDDTHVAANGQIRCWLPADAASGQEELW